MEMVVKTNGGTLNMRASASKGARILWQIPNHTKLSVLSYGSEWSKILYKNQEGYVMSSFLTSTDTSTISKADLQTIYTSLKATLETIEKIIK